MSPVSLKLAHKMHQLAAMLEAGTVLVHVNAQHVGIKLPARYMGRADVVLALHLSPEQDDRVWCDISDPTGVVAQLVFAEGPFRCGLPWDAIWAAWSEPMSQMTVWQSDAPAEAPTRPRLQLVRA